MVLKFYGTGASEGVPAPFCDCETCAAARRLGGAELRARACCVIDGRLMIDFPPDTFAHALYGDLDLRRVEAVLFTHAHPDHFYPRELVNLAPPMAVRLRSEDVDVCGPREVVAAVEAVVRREERGRVPVRTRGLEAGRTVDIAGFRVLPLRVVHDPSMECFAYVIEREGKALLFLCDSGLPTGEVWASLLGRRYDAVVMDCTYADEPHAPCGHMGLVENLRVAAGLREAGCADGNTAFVATHFAHTGAPLTARLGRVFSGTGILPAHDGYTLEF